MDSSSYMISSQRLYVFLCFSCICFLLPLHITASNALSMAWFYRASILCRVGNGYEIISMFWHQICDRLWCFVMHFFPGLLEISVWCHVGCICHFSRLFPVLICVNVLMGSGICDVIVVVIKHISEFPHHPNCHYRNAVCIKWMWLICENYMLYM